MNSVVMDTHVAVWSLLDRTRLSQAAVAAINAANTSNSPVFVPTISIVEITYLIEKRRLPATLKTQLLAALDSANSNLTSAPLDRDIADRLAGISRHRVPDMPDRIIAATALHLGVPLISRDGRIRASNLQTIW